MVNQNLAIERAIAILSGCQDKAAQEATNVLVAAWEAPGRASKAKPRTLRAIKTAGTISDLLSPVGRRKLRRDRKHEHVIATTRDGAEIRLTIGRDPKDSDAVAREVGRRLAILFRAAEIANEWQTQRHAELAAAVTALRETLGHGESDYEAFCARRDAIEDAFSAFGGDLRQWHCRVDGRKVLSWNTAILERAERDIVHIAMAPPESLYATAAE